MGAESWRLEAGGWRPEAGRGEGDVCTNVWTYGYTDIQMYRNLPIHMCFTFYFLSPLIACSLRGFKQGARKRVGVYLG